MSTQTKFAIIALVFGFTVGVLVAKSLIGSNIWKADQPKVEAPAK